jgi:preprotein translocase subunit SecA
MSEPLAARLAPDAIYPEHREPWDPSWVERAGGAAFARAQRALRASPRRAARIVPLAAALEAEFAQLELAQLAAAAREIGRRLRGAGLSIGQVAHSFALVRRAAQLTLGKRHFDVQLTGAWVMLQGMVAEMQTGEGKTLTATLAAATAALAGRPVHVITVNDYLVTRDTELMRPVYESLGLTVAAVTAEMQHDQRQAAYGADIVYCSNKTIVFDYLRDRIVLGPTASDLQLKVERLAGRRARTRRLLLRGLHYAIVDEADSVLVDEARTPLIISANAGAEGDEQTARTAYALAGQLVEVEHYRVYKGERRVVLTEAGRQRLIDLCQGQGGLWAVPIRREEVVLRALTAAHLFHRDEHYLVREGKIQVVDEFTGRVMADRSWGQGLHQIIEVKEGCAVTEVRDTLARISYQRFFQRYLHLSGMTGTAREVRRELGAVYGLPVVSIPTNRPPRRVYHPDQVFVSDALKWEHLARRVALLHQQGVPVLIGTRSVATSEVAAAALAACGLPHTLLSAKQDQAEAQVVAAAGIAGAITIATNMAGRGTDIILGPGVAEKGGLHVILTERHEAGRIDRQLAGRAARQGDPGSFEAVLSLEDALLLPVQAGVAGRLAAPWLEAGGPLAQRLRVAWIRYAQWRTERGQAAVRRHLLKSDRQLGKTLSFSGRPE